MILANLKYYWLKRRFQHNIRKWFRCHGDQTLRLEYPLTAESVVFDVGGFHGDFAAEIYARYQCHIHVFEPVRVFCDLMRERFKAQPKIQIHCHGLGRESARVSMTVADDRSSHVAANQAAATEWADIVAFADFARDRNITGADLVKINIEGAEYDLIEHLIEQQWIEKIQDLQVQFHHFVPRAAERREALRRQLCRTHEETYCFYFVWENWRRRSPQAATLQRPSA